MNTPPRWADALLRLLVRADDVDSVSGDLLEEYREVILPSRGRLGADLWFLMEVAGAVWRQAAVWGVLVGVLLILRFWFDVFVPREQWPSPVTKQALTTIYLIAAWRATRRTGHIRAGVIVAFVAGTIGAVVGLAGPAAILAALRDPATLAAMQQNGDVQEMLSAAFAMPWFGAAIGTVGAVGGKSLRALIGSRRA